MSDVRGLAIDNRNVHELVLSIEGLGQDEQMVCESNPQLLARYESALRRKAIEEASVGEVSVKITEYKDEITAPVGSPDRIVTCSERIVSQAWIPAGEYYLVCKEVSP